jgi:hypothetical protein
LPLAAALALVVIVCLPVASYELGRLRFRNDPGPDGARIVDRQDLSAAIPERAKVANPWRSTPIYMYWAPQGRYLNVLDPVFLAAHDPAVFAAQDEIFAGTEPDVPMRAAAVLDSGYIAYSAATGDKTLTARLLADPRIETRYRGINLLFEIRAPATEVFITDWHLVPPDLPLPVAPDVDVSGWPDYPLVGPPELRRLEGFVDGRRVAAPGQCIGAVHRLEIDAARDLRLELAAMGPMSLWLDERPVVELGDGGGAVLGRGAAVELSLAPGEHRLNVLSCPASPSGTAGFYLVRRDG